eukprot:CAMPEP_0194210614 /NCGR_PEP_ID=MMETSP0156-20130528/8829_1 /TAXON_ID=33649 /ORGANISM="Thalassionema nitzschioides, Strain L26-B" /LENGTH=327 /DNA_ID=CAMNT_0038937981 /DNA_START=42 /DNA_END=1025 /DNA_ORIENTATION=+
MPPSTGRRTYVNPTCDDVLCGRGNIPFQHPGNHMLRKIIAERLDYYNLCQSRQGRTAIIRETIRYILVNQGGRFLKAGKYGQWYDGGLEAAKSRVSTAFRDALVPNKVKCMEALKKKNVNSFKNDEYTSGKDLLTSLPFSVQNTNFATKTRRSSLSSVSVSCVDHLLGCPGDSNALGFLDSSNIPKESLDSSISTINTEVLTDLVIPDELPSSSGIDTDTFPSSAAFSESRESLESSLSTIDTEILTDLKQLPTCDKILNFAASLNEIELNKDQLDFGGRIFFSIAASEGSNANSSFSALSVDELARVPQFHGDIFGEMRLVNARSA